MLPLNDLRENPKRKHFPVLVDGAVGELLLLPYVDADGRPDVPEVHEFGNEIRSDATGSDSRYVETKVSVPEVKVHVGHLPARGLPFAERNARENSVDKVKLATLLIFAHPLGELALTDVEMNGAVGGIMCAGESVVVVTHSDEGKKVKCLKELVVMMKGDKGVAFMGGMKETHARVTPQAGF